MGDDLHSKLQAEEHEAILAACEADGMDMTVCRAMSFKELQTMWGDYQSDLASANYDV